MIKLSHIILYSFSLYQFAFGQVFNNAFSGKVDTVYSFCNGFWSDSLTWKNKKVPSNTDYVIINHYIRMDKNVYMNSPGKIYISSSGALCGTYALTTEFIAYGIMNVGPLSTYGNCINYNTINIDGNYIGISGTWTLNGNACIGCSFTCNAISHIPPVAIFASVQSVCVGSNITFIDKSLNSPGSWYWLFPGGVPSTSTKQNPAIVLAP